MPQERSVGKPTTRRYSAEEKAAAVRMVRALRAETGMTHGAVRRVAQQLGYGGESVRGRGGACGGGGGWGGGEGGGGEGGGGGAPRPPPPGLGGGVKVLEQEV